MTVVAAPGGPGWTDILTAIGTVGAVIAAVGIALWTQWRWAGSSLSSGSMRRRRSRMSARMAGRSSRRSAAGAGA